MQKVFQRKKLCLPGCFLLAPWRLLRLRALPQKHWLSSKMPALKKSAKFYFLEGVQVNSIFCVNFDKPHVTGIFSLQTQQSQSFVDLFKAVSFNLQNRRDFWPCVESEFYTVKNKFVALVFLIVNTAEAIEF